MMAAIMSKWKLVGRTVLLVHMENSKMLVHQRGESALTVSEKSGFQRQGCYWE